MFYFNRTLLIVLMSLLTLGQQQAHSLENEGDKEHFFVEKNVELLYEIEGDNYYGHSSELRVGEQYFSEDIVKEKKCHFASSLYTNRKNVVTPENSINMNRFADNALSLIFIHPDRINYNLVDGKNKLLHLNIDLHRVKAQQTSSYNECLKFLCKAKTTSSGWSYKLNFSREGLVYYKINAPEDQGIVDFTININTKYDSKNKRVKSAKIEYELKLGKMIDSKGKIIAKPKASITHKYALKLKFKEELSAASGQDQAMHRAVAMSHQYILENMKDFLAGKKAFHFRDHEKKYNRVGISALAFYALLHSGLDPDKKEGRALILQYFSWLAEQGFKSKGVNLGNNTRCTYTCSILLMMLDALLLDSKPQEGKYRVRLRGPSKIRKQGMGLAKACLAVIDGKTRGHKWYYQGARSSKVIGDKPAAYSRSQYAILGLRSATNLGLKLRETTWSDIPGPTMKDASPSKSKMPAKAKDKISFFDSSILYGEKFEPEGFKGWSYTGKSDPDFNMTCSGLGSLIVAGSNLNEGKFSAETKKLMFEGILYLQKNLKTKPRYLNYYKYYSFERVAMFYGINHIDGENWHEVMSKNIIDRQTATGKFTVPETGSYRDVLLCNAYALLFLKKATKPMRKYSTSTK